MDWQSIGSALIGCTSGLLTILFTLGFSRVERRFSFVYETDTRTGGAGERAFGIEGRTAEHRLQATVGKPSSPGTGRSDGSSPGPEPEEENSAIAEEWK